MKKIFVNGLSALRGGGQTYLLQLCKEVPAMAEVYLALPDELAARFPQRDNVALIRAEFPQRSLLHRLLWENCFLPGHLRRRGIDIYYQPSGTLPWATPEGVRCAIAFRNMLPFAPREAARFDFGFKRFRYRVLRHLLTRSFQAADLVIFVSQFAKSVIDRTVPNRLGRSAIIYHGLDEHFRSPAPAPEGMPGEYVLYVSILNYYKAQVEVVRAWSLLRAKRPTPETLVLAGPENSSYGRRVRLEVERLGLQNEVLFTAEIPHAKMPAYLQHAKLNIFASSCENCPIILLEQLATGRPILCSSYPPMPEVAGQGALYFDPYSPEDLCHLLLDTIDDPDKLREMGKEASSRACLFSWQRTRHSTWQALLKL